MRKMLVTLIVLLAVGVAQAQNPYVGVNFPPNNSEVGDNFTLTGNGPPNGMVMVYGAVQGQARVNARGNWQMHLSTRGMPIGESVRITVVGQDAYGNQSAPVYRRYYAAYGNPGNNPGNNQWDTREPVRLSANAPTNGSTLGRAFTLSGSGTPGAIVEVSGAVNASGYVNNNGYWQVRIDARAYAGQVIYLNVRGRDRYGNYSPVSRLKYAIR